MSASWLDASPGQGRSARAFELAEQVDAEQLTAALRYCVVLVASLYIDEDGIAAEQLRALWYGELEYRKADRLEVRRKIAIVLARISVAARALRLQKQGARNTCKLILDASTEPL